DVLEVGGGIPGPRIETITAAAAAAPVGEIGRFGQVRGHGPGLGVPGIRRGRDADVGFGSAPGGAVPPTVIGGLAALVFDVVVVPVFPEIKLDQSHAIGHVVQSRPVDAGGGGA